MLTGSNMTAVIAGEGRRDERIRTDFAQQLTNLDFPCSFVRGRDCIEFLIRVVGLIAEIKKLLIPAQMLAGCLMPVVCMFPDFQCKRCGRWGATGG